MRRQNARGWVAGIAAAAVLGILAGPAWSNPPSPPGPPGPPRPGIAGPGVSAAPAPPAASDPEPPPPGWTMRAGSAGVVVRWRPPGPVPIRSGRLTVRTGGGQTAPAIRTADGAVEAVFPGRLTGLGGLVAYSGQTPLTQIIAAAAAARPTPRPEPGRRAPAADGVVVADYTLPAIAYPGYRWPLLMRGHVVAPAAAAGSRPLVVFLHGRHEYCYRPGSQTPGYDWPCASGTRPVPSLLGYEYLQRDLAAQGFVTVSIDANAINAQDDSDDDGGAAARSLLVRRHLAALAGWGGGARAPFAATVAARYDVTRVLLVGHSRGGDGVRRATIDANPGDAFRIRGLVEIAPTNFLRETAPATPTVVLLPSCDGDVSDLQGQLAVDQAAQVGPVVALHTSVRIPGANHNHFNTQWTPGLSAAPSLDDGSFTSCAAGSRLSAAAQRTAGLTWLRASAKALLEGDSAAAGYLDGSLQAPPDGSLPGAAVVPVGGPRRLLWKGGPTAPSTNPASPAGWCTGPTCQPGLRTIGPASWCDGATCPTHLDSGSDPHWLTADVRSGRAVALTLADGTPAGVRFAQARDLSGWDFLETRVVVRPETTVRLAVRLTDVHGTVAVLDPAGDGLLAGYPAARGAPVLEGNETGSRALARLLRVPLSGAGLDLSAVTSIEWVSRSGATRLVVLDSSVARDGVASPALPGMSRLSFTTKPTVREGNVAVVHRLPLAVSASFAEAVTLGVTIEGQGATAPESRTTWSTLPAGTRSLSIPVTIPGGVTYDGAESPIYVSLEVRGPAMLSRATTEITVVENDPRPRLTLSTYSNVREGRTLSWSYRLDRRASIPLYYDLTVARTKRRALSARDLTAGSRAAWGSLSNRALPLASLNAAQTLVVEPFHTRGVVWMSTVKDRLRERPEYVNVVVSNGYPARVIGRLVGRVH